MLCFLNNNAAAVQALSAVASLIVTVFLAYFTHKYVGLTKAIADAASTQTQAVADARFALLHRKASALKALSRRIRLPLQHLNQSTIDLVELRGYSLLTSEDISELQNLAGEVSTEAVGLAAKAAISLRNLHGMITAANGSAAGSHWRFTSTDVDRWSSSIKAVQATLVALETESAAALLPSDSDS